MAKRASPPVFGRTFQRSLVRLARSAARAGARALTPAKRPAVRRTRAALPDPGWTAGIATRGVASRRWRLYMPPDAGRDGPLPLLVMLHGCGQDATGLAAASRMNRLAARKGFLVLYPEQDRFANGQGCWNWYETRNGRAQAEAAVIVAAVDDVLARGVVDPTRVAIAGLSAGAGMAALVAMRFPTRFRAVAMHSGVAPGAAQSIATALAAMHGHRPPVFDEVAASDGVAALPPLLVIHGSDDGVVHAVVGRDAAAGWAAAVGATAMSPRTVRRGARRPMRVTDFRSNGRVWVSHCEVEGLGHAWSGGAAGQSHADPSGPDAASLIWTFASRAFGPAASPVGRAGTARKAESR